MRQKAKIKKCKPNTLYNMTMNDAERAVVDDFQGREAYEQVMAQPDHYLIAPGSMLPALTA